jgi:formamidopyrimidine-DNA glycosylase
MVLKDFIDRKMREYGKQGISVSKRGSAGSPEKKYEASLRALERKTLSTTAEALELKKPSLIRKWHADPEFKTLVKEHCIEFAKEYGKTLLEHKRIGKAVHEYLQGEQGITQNDLIEPSDIFKVLRLNDKYGFRLREALVRWLLESEKTTHDDEESTIVFLSAAAALMTPHKIRLRLSLLEKEREIKNEIRLRCISAIKKELNKNDFAKREKRTVVCLLNVIQELNQ